MLCNNLLCDLRFTHIEKFLVQYPYCRWKYCSNTASKRHADAMQQYIPQNDQEITLLSHMWISHMLLAERDDPARHVSPLKWQDTPY